MMMRALQIRVDVVYSKPNAQTLAGEAPFQTVEAAAKHAAQVVLKHIRRLPKDHVCLLAIAQRDIEVREEEDDGE